MKIWPFTKREQTDSEPVAGGKSSAAAPSVASQDAPARPVYQKPTLRRYDQIDQVKPYGPSEI